MVRTILPPIEFCCWPNTCSTRARIMATGAGTFVCGASGGALDADGCDDASPSGIDADTDASPRLFVPATRGAMIAFSTLVELQTGQLTTPRLT